MKISTLVQKSISIVIDRESQAKKSKNQFRQIWNLNNFYKNQVDIFKKIKNILRIILGCETLVTILYSEISTLRHIYTKRMRCSQTVHLRRYFNNELNLLKINMS